MGRGGGQVVVCGGGGQVAEMVYGLLWWLCCGGDWVMGRGSGQVVPIWAFAPFRSIVPAFVGCHGWLGRIVGRGGGWVMVRGDERWVVEMICGLL